MGTELTLTSLKAVYQDVANILRWYFWEFDSVHFDMWEANQAAAPQTQTVRRIVQRWHVAGVLLVSTWDI